VKINTTQYRIMLQWLLGASGTITSLILSSGANPITTNLWVLLGTGFVTAIGAAFWGITDSSTANQISSAIAESPGAVTKAVSNLPDVKQVVTRDAPVSDSIRAVLADPTTAVIGTTEARQKVLSGGGL
jgi:hypothetical protein